MKAIIFVLTIILFAYYFVIIIGKIRILHFRFVLHKYINQKIMK